MRQNAIALGIRRFGLHSLSEIANLWREGGTGMLRLILAILFCFVMCTSCSGGSSGDDGENGSKIPDATPIDVAGSDYSYRLSQSTAALGLWTTPAARKVRAGMVPPAAEGDGLRVSAARNEYEPVQLVLQGTVDGLRVEASPFETVPDVEISIASLSYNGALPHALVPVNADGSVRAWGGVPVLWLTFYVPEGTPAGLHHTTLQLHTRDAGTVSIPVALEVYDFTLPKAISFHSQLNISISSLIPEGGGEADAKNRLFAHRLTPASVSWPSGFGYGITWDNTHSPTRCNAFYDEGDEQPAYSIRHLARRYILGEGWNGVGFPDSQIFQFVNNSTPRPDTFCDIPRGDHHGSAAYNEAWSKYLKALADYLREAGMLDRTYYYVQNEPQNDADHRLAAHLCRLTRAAAPGLRIAISEEPKPEIAEDAGGACGYDIWIAHVRAFHEAYSLRRQRDHKETLWFYTLPQDPRPYFNPSVLERDGMDARIIPWVSWRYRARGWAYYNGALFFPDGRDGVVAELLREGFEDYEYLVLANGGIPAPGKEAPMDATVLSVATSLTSWNQDPDAMMALRHELALYISGKRASAPLLAVDDGGLSRKPIYLSFQNPSGEPKDDPLVVDGLTYQKVGWKAWDEEAGMGWFGEYINNPQIALYGFDSGSGTVVERSYIYDDYGRDNLFEMRVANGRYTVTVGAGRVAKAYPKDPHFVRVEGVVLIDDEPTTDAMRTFKRSAEIEIRDGKLSLEMGGKSPTTNDFAYTFLQYLHLVPMD